MNASDDILIFRNALHQLVAACQSGRTDLVDEARIVLKDIPLPPTLADSSSSIPSFDLFGHILGYFAFEKDQESDLARGFRMLAFQSLKDSLGQDSIVLSDFYLALAARLSAFGRLPEAIEFAGRALLIRIQALGVMAMKTAESHFQLGNLYLRSSHFDEGRRELNAARTIYSKLCGEKSTYVTDCDMLLGQLETKSYRHDQAYVHYVRGFRSRFLQLGADHELTLSAYDIMETCRKDLGNRHYVCAELLDRAVELGWHECAPESFLYFLFVYLTQLQQDNTVVADDLLGIVERSFLLYLSRQKLSHAEAEAVDRNEIAYNLSLRALPRDQTLRLRISSSAFSPNTSPSSTLKKSSSFQRSNSERQINLSSSPPIEEIKTSSDVIPEAAVKTENPNSTSIASTSAPTSVHKSTSSDCITQVTVSSPESLQLKTFADKAKGQQQQHQPGIRRKSTVSNFGSPSITAAISPRPKHWKPIPLNSPLRTGAIKKTVVIRNMKDDAPNFVRDDFGDLLVVTKCTPQTLQQTIQSRLVAFGLLAWLSQNILQDKLKEVRVKRSKTVLSAAASSANAGEEGGKAGAKNSLNALFGKRGPPAGASTGAVGAVGTVSKGVEGNSDAAKMPSGRLPMPPPLPTSWPPVPYDPQNTADTGEDTPGVGPKVEGSNGGPAVVDPRPKLKQIHLQTLASVEGTFWEDASDSLFKPEELFDDLEDEFIVGGPKNKKPAFGGGGSPSPVKLASTAKGKVSKTETALDPQRAQNINIMLAKFGKRSLDSIAEGIVNFEPIVVGLASINSLQQFIPTAEETAKVRTFVEKKWKAHMVEKVKAKSGGDQADASPNDGKSNEVAVVEAPSPLIEAAPKPPPPPMGNPMAAVAAAAAAAAKRALKASGSSEAEVANASKGNTDAEVQSPVASATAPKGAAKATVEKSSAEMLNELTTKELTELRIDRAEQYIFIMSKIRGLERRLTGLSMVLCAQELHQYVKDNTEVLLTAVGEVRGSGRLRFILRSILELNNALIKNSKQVGGAASNSNNVAAVSGPGAVGAPSSSGFPLSQWSKMAQVKCNSGETATQYLVTKLLQRIPESLELSSDLPSVDEARGVLLARLAANVKKLEESVATLLDLQKEENNTQASTNIVAALAEVQRYCQDAGTRHSQALTDFIQMCQLFGETCPPMDAESFFGELSALCKALGVAVAAAGNKSKRKLLASGISR